MAAKSVDTYKSVDVVEETFAIIFSEVPPNYTCKDIILNHFSKASKPIISDEKLDRWRRAIRLIEFKNNKCFVVFSSIFYWCKYARRVEGRRNKGLKVSIHPKYYTTIEHPLNVDFISCNANNELVELYNIPQSIIAYTFIHNGSIYITTELQSTQELLIKIPASNISKITVNMNSGKEEHKCSDSEMTVSLNENCEVYEYYHRNKLWKCSICSNVNKVEDITESEMYCNCCDATCDANSDYHYLQINAVLNHTDLNAQKTYFIHDQQKHFYRKISAFAESKMFNVLSPLFNVLDEKKRDIASSIMFTNVIKLRCKDPSNKMVDYLSANMNKIQIEIVAKSVECRYCDFSLLQKALKSTLVWLSVHRSMIFPFLSRLLDFQNPAFLCSNVEKYVDAIDELLESRMEWLMKEVIMGLTTLDIDQLTDRADALEQHYDDKGVFDVDDETSKGPFVYELQLLPFHIGIKETDIELLNTNKDWTNMHQVSTDNYVVSFNNYNTSQRSSVYDAFQALSQRMQINSFFLIDDKRNEIMHYLKRSDEFIQYGATILNNPLSDDKFVEYFKRKQVNQSKINEYADCDDVEYKIDKSAIYHNEPRPAPPPLKKIKMNIKNNNDNVNKAAISRLNIEANQAMQLWNNNTMQMPKKHKSKPLEIDSKTCKSKPLEIKAIGKHIPKKKIVQKKCIKPSGNNDTERNKVGGRKRKRKMPIPKSFMRKKAMPKSFMRKKAAAPAKPAKPVRASPESDSCSEDYDSGEDTDMEQMDYSNISALNIVGAVGWAYGVPIYNKYYWDCAGIHFDLHRFAELVMLYACKTDLVVKRELRNIRGRGDRGRKCVKADEATAKFLVVLQEHARYLGLFEECFAWRNTEKEIQQRMDIDLRDFCSKEKLKERENREFIIFDREYWIREPMKYRLFLLLEMLCKHLKVGCVREVKPFWSGGDQIDLTTLDDDDSDVEMKNNNDGYVRIGGAMCDDEYDSDL